MTPLRRGDGTGLSVPGVREVRTGDGRVLYEDAIPDSEGFEHNDLTGVYDGDTGGFEIQTTTAFEGQYALRQTEIGSNNWIVRDTDPFDRAGIRADFQLQIPSDSGDGGTGGGGIAFSPSVTGRANADGYQVFISDNTFQLFRLNNNSGTLLDESSGTYPTDTWTAGSIEFRESGEIAVEYDGVTISATDTTYTSLLLGAAGFDPFVLDDIQFSQI